MPAGAIVTITFNSRDSLLMRLKQLSKSGLSGYAPALLAALSALFAQQRPVALPACPCPDRTRRARSWGLAARTT